MSSTARTTGEVAATDRRHPKHGEGNGSLVGPGARARGPQEGDLERPALGLGQRRERLLEDGLEEITERGVGQPRLGLDRTAGQDPVVPREGIRQPFLPHRGLADAGIAGQEQRARAARDRVEESLEDGELGLASDDFTRTCSPRLDGRQDSRDGGREASEDPVEQRTVGAPAIARGRVGGGRGGWDSNPRTGRPVSGFQDRRLRPLGHPPGSQSTRVPPRPGRPHPPVDERGAPRYVR